MPHPVLNAPISLLRQRLMASIEVADIFPCCRACLPGRPCRTAQPAAAQGHVGDQTLPHPSARRPRRGLRGLWPTADRVQQLPQPALSEVPNPVRSKRWVVYAKPPFAGPEAVLAYLSRYTHRVAISNRRIIRLDESDVTFRYKDYRRPDADRQQVMTLTTDELIRRFLLHIRPRGFHRIRHYGLLAGSARKAGLALARELLAAAPSATNDPSAEPDGFRPPCPCCGGRMIVIEVFERVGSRADRRSKRRRTGRTPHDPAWRSPAFSHRHSALATMLTRA